MAKPTSRSALEAQGFRLVGSHFDGSSDRVGTAMAHHYVLTKSHGNSVFPVEHHVVVHEFSKSPGKYNVTYNVARLGHLYDPSNLSTARNHKDNQHRGVSDPIGEILEHHQMVGNILKHREYPFLNPIKPGRENSMMPGQHDMASIDNMQRLNSLAAARLMDQADEDLRP